MVYGMMLFFDANVEMARFPPEIGRGIERKPEKGETKQARGI